MNKEINEYHGSNELPVALPKVGIIGLGRAGKGTATEILEETFNFKGFTVSKLIREYAGKNNIVLNGRQDFWRTKLEMQELFGENTLLERSIARLQEIYYNSPDTVNGVVLDGVRFPSFLRNFKKLPNSYVIGINTHPLVRYERDKILRPSGVISLEEFLEDESLEMETVNQALGLSDVIIENNAERDELKSQLVKVITNRFEF